jgi:hypothetical protein
VYLFEIGIPALQMQKNNREMEIIVQECILTTIRDSIPVESILRAYMEESVEEEIVPIAAAPNKEKEKEKEKEEKDKKEKEKKEREEKEEKEKEERNKEKELTEPLSFASVGDSASLKFNDNDSVMYSDNKEEIVSAPKTIERLEEISDARYNQRKLEAEMEEDEDRIKISDQNVSLTDCVDLNASSASASAIPDLVLDIEELPF